MTNLGLKLKVFFLMAVVITGLSVANFLLFKDFIVKIDVQDGAKNAARLVENELKNINYSLIGNSFAIASQMKIEKGKIVPGGASDFDYVIVNNAGAVIYSENINIMNSYAGVPAVDRALKSGVASDGILSFESDLYLVGAAPVSADGKIFAAVSFKKLSNDFLSVFPMPVRVFKGGSLVSEKGGDSWSSVEGSFGKAAFDSSVSELLRNSGSKELNNWTRISSFFMPFDLAGGEKIAFVVMTSLIPGWESYDKVVFWVVCYSIAALLIAIFFTFIVTHEIDKILKNLASDISRMRVGDKLVLKRYSNGADIVVSAMNKLIQKYLELKDDVTGLTSSPLGRSTEKGIDEFDAPIADPFANENADENKFAFEKPAAREPEKTQQKHVAEPQPKPEVKPEPAVSAVSDDDDDDDNEKTQIAATVSSVAATNPFDALWEDYCRIKRKNGETVSEKEKTAFIGKVRTNKASIMAKYKCADVQFSVEEKEGKPVVKAKPIN